MKLLKVEKDNCPACNTVGAFLDNESISYEKLNIQGEDEAKAEQARDILGKLELFTVPVTVLVNGEGEIVDYARGFDAPKLAELAEQVR